jgi:hypothetical protein
MLSVQRRTISVQRRAINVQRPAINVQRRMINVQRRAIKLQECENTEQIARFAGSVSIPSDRAPLCSRIDMQKSC